jgi:hypothetical protein
MNYEYLFFHYRLGLYTTQIKDAAESVLELSEGRVGLSLIG